MTFYFYDLETSSGSPRNGRIMQFAGQRTNEQLEAIGEPTNILVKLADDVIPEPDAILVHGITPQQTLQEGLSEAEFAELFHEQIAQPETVFVGYNNIRFDDEFMRLLCYRTFYDPYEWHWKDNKGRWDLLDAIRMMRALRPDGLKWPMQDGKPTVRLESMARENGIIHENAHDALSDVQALIELARRFKSGQPKLFDYLLKVRDKKAVAAMATSDTPFVYTSGKYDTEFHKTTVVQSLMKHPRREAAIVYDLRYDPTQWLAMDAAKLAEHWGARYGSDLKQPPLKTMQFNRCPAIAPIQVLDQDSKKRIGYDDSFIKHQQLLAANPDFVHLVAEALDILENKQQTQFALDDTDVDAQLYDGFWVDADRGELVKIRHTDPAEFSVLVTAIKNKRLREMMPLYKARNYPKKLAPEEHEAWDSFRRKKLYAGGEKSPLARYGQRMLDIAKTRQLSSNDEYLLAELQLYVESIVPEPPEEV